MRRALFVVVLAVVALAGVRGWQAAGALRDAETTARELQSLLLGGELEAAQALLPALQTSTGRAVESTHGPAWRVISFVPVAGRTPRAVTSAAEAVDELAREVLPPLLSVAGRWSPERLRPEGDRIALDVVAAEAPLLAEQQQRVRRLREPLAERGGVLGPVADAVRQLDDRLRRVDDALTAAAGVARVAPAVLGAEEPRRWFVALQTNAESRGTGGLVGAYAVLTAQDGRLSLTELGSNSGLEDLPGTDLSFGPEFEALYGADPALWSNSNMSPHFPYAAQLWVDKWQAMTGERLDGALATDPVALARVLIATGPIALPGGDELTADNAVSLTEQTSYERFPDSEERKAYLVDLMRAVVDRLLTSQDVDGGELLTALLDVADEGRLLAWSARPEEQDVLAKLPSAGIAPEDEKPYVHVVVNNGGGNKLDYYLGRRVVYERDGCRGDRRRTRVAVTLENDVPPDLPHYVTGATGGPDVRGSHRLIVAVHTTRGARLEAATLDGAATEVFVRSERGRPVLVATVDLAPGQARSLVLHLDEPAVDGDPEVAEQPLARAQETVLIDSAC